MNILLIGNGFDLAHGLPTRYDDFLDFIKVISQFISRSTNPNIDVFSKSKEWENLNKEIKYQIVQNMRTSNDFIDNWKNLIIDNIWFEYFFENRGVIKENWIDFEKEIYFVVSNLDLHINKNKMSTLSDSFFDEKFESNNIIRNFHVLKISYCKKIRLINQSIDSFIKELENDLEKLIFALEIYINQYVNKVKIKKFSRDITKLQIDKVISFNYSNTFKLIYRRQVDYDFVHGKAVYHKSYEDNDLVLGINEYLPDEEKNTNLQFIRYKKFFQRIHKNTGCKYTDWIKEINNFGMDSNLYIFGHSLDETDGDILRDLILNDKITTTIFYHNKEAYEQQIKNLVKVVGQGELIKRTGGLERSIKFAKQLDFASFK